MKAYMRFGRNSFSHLLRIRQAFTLTTPDSAEGLKKEVGRLRKRNRILVVLSLIIVVLSLAVASVHFSLVNAAIVKVQGNARGTTTSNPLTITMGSTPTNGNVEVLTYASAVYDDTSQKYRTVSMISQTGVTWAGSGPGKQISKTQSGMSYLGYDAEIWYGVVGSGASTSITVYQSGTGDETNGAVADVCEYSGMLTSSFLDKTASLAGTNNPTGTGTTATTAQANELWIGAICDGDTANQVSPTNGFTLLDGAGDGTAWCPSNGYLQKIVSSTGTAGSATSSQYGGYWCGCVATFIAAPSGYSFTVTSAYDSPSPYGVGTTNGLTGSIDESVTSPVGTEVCTGWTGTGSCPASGSTTDTGSWSITATSSITWNWAAFSASITVNTATHSWTINPGDNNVSINENAVGGKNGYISLTVTSNGAFDIGAKASGALTYGSNTIALSYTNMSASTWSAAIALTTSYQTIPGLSNVASGSGLSEKVYLWLSCPTNVPAGAYTESITFEIIQHGGSY